MLLNVVFTCLFFILSAAIIYLIVYFFDLRKNKKDSQQVLNVEDCQNYDFKDENIKTKKAIVLCSPDKELPYKRFNYTGKKDCNIFKQIYNSRVECSFACIGFGSCKAYCNEEAIEIKNDTAVINENCTGCARCIQICPNHLIKLVDCTQTEENKDCANSGCTLCNKKEIESNKIPSKFWALCNNLKSKKQQKQEN